jgi:hypothetical protein
MAELFLEGMRPREALDALDRYGIEVRWLEYDEIAGGTRLRVEMTQAQANSLSIYLAAIPMTYTELPVPPPPPPGSHGVVSGTRPQGYSPSRADSRLSSLGTSA